MRPDYSFTVGADIAGTQGLDLVSAIERVLGYSASVDQYQGRTVATFYYDQQLPALEAVVELVDGVEGMRLRHEFDCDLEVSGVTT